MKFWDSQDERSVVFITVMATAGLICVVDTVWGLDPVRASITRGWRTVSCALPHTISYQRRVCNTKPEIARQGAEE
jgi:hypothetical protein